MYLSLLLYLLASTVYLSNLLALLFLPAFVLYLNQFQIKPEERVLFSLFGPEYAAYKGTIRRWLSGMTPSSSVRPHDMAVLPPRLKDSILCPNIRNRASTWCCPVVSGMRQLLSRKFRQQ